MFGSEGSKKVDFGTTLRATGAKSGLSQDMPLWHAEDVKLKTIKAQKTQKETLTFPQTA